MRITINVPDNLPREVVEKYLFELEEKLKQFQTDEEFKINEQTCLDTLAKIKQGDKSSITEIANVKDYIRELKNEVG